MACVDLLLVHFFDMFLTTTQVSYVNKEMMSAETNLF